MLNTQFSMLHRKANGQGHLSGASENNAEEGYSRVYASSSKEIAAIPHPGATGSPVPFLLRWAQRLTGGPWGYGVTPVPKPQHCGRLGIRSRRIGTKK